MTAKITALSVSVMALALGVGVVWAGQDGQCSACSDKAQTSAMAATQPATRPAKTHVCPMHPEVTGSATDKCPKCGMSLESKQEKKTGAGA